MFEMSFRYKFEAAHRFTKSCADSCATPHGHTWSAELLVRSVLDGLDGNDMVVEFAKVKSRWKVLLDKVLDHSYLSNVNDPILPSLRTHIPKLRLMPFPGDPTTELLATLLFNKASKFIEADNLSGVLKVQSIQIQETPTNGITYFGDCVDLVDGSFCGYTGWWNSFDPYDRTIFEKA
jgi:6-pyruvoyl-tetrahydropterin synthase